MALGEPFLTDFPSGIFLIVLPTMPSDADSTFSRSTFRVVRHS